MNYICYKHLFKIGVLRVFILCVFLFSCRSQYISFKIDYEKYTLDNGLEVILHEDKSDPIVSVAILYHVGSNREVRGRTGFAHLFEHMLFQESQHIGQDEFFRKIQDAGGILNGGTWKDGTIYFEVVPKNALEMVLWMESDRMGFFLNTVTQESFKNQQEVVQNEKRQRYDNAPYGHTNYVIDKNLYPENHPYNWQTIGSLQDLQNATLNDVRDFYEKWYGVNNVTISVAGDFEREQTIQWIEKYFGEIKPAKPVENPSAINTTLSNTIKVYYEDNFASSPELNMVFPTIEQFTRDSYALNFLAQLLGEGKKAPLYQVIVEDWKLAPSVSVNHNSMELTGSLRIRIRTFPDINMTTVEEAIFKAFNKFEIEGFTEDDINRIKAKYEVEFYRKFSSILGKSFRLVMYNEFAGSPDFITNNFQNTLEVTKEDIIGVYNTYIKDKPYVITSFIPRGHNDLVVEGSVLFPVDEENILDASKRTKKQMVHSYENLQSIALLPAFDRSLEPPKGPAPELNIPDVWTHTYNNKLRIYGIEHNELPLIQFSITLRGGLLLDNPDLVGVANLMSKIMMEGTANKTPIELEEAIEQLGSSISMYTTEESIVIEAKILKSKFTQTLALVEEIIMEPRWDEKEFNRIKAEIIEDIKRSDVNPRSIADNVFNKLVYGNNHILGYSISGTIESVERISIDDLKEFYEANFSPSVSYLAIVGDITYDNTISSFHSLSKRWDNKSVSFSDYSLPEPLSQSSLYFVDVPSAKQSDIRIGYLALPYAHPDYYSATVMNMKLGGNFSGYLNLVLREEKGFTYGARSKFSGSIFPGPFVAYAAVQSNATIESIQIFKDEMSKYQEEIISNEDLQFTKNTLVNSNALRFERFKTLLDMINDIAKYDLPINYIKHQEQIVQSMTQQRHQELAQKYIQPDRMIYLVVGDAQTQLEPLLSLGLGEPILLDKNGKTVK